MSGERSQKDILEELVSLRESCRTYSDERTRLRDENERLTRDLENTQVLLHVCLDTLKRHGIGLTKK